MCGLLPLLFPSPPGKLGVFFDLSNDFFISSKFQSRTQRENCYWFGNRWNWGITAQGWAYGEQAFPIIFSCSVLPFLSVCQKQSFSGKPWVSKQRTPVPCLRHLLQAPSANNLPSLLSFPFFFIFFLFLYTVKDLTQGLAQARKTFNHLLMSSTSLSKRGMDSCNH